MIKRMFRMLAHMNKLLLPKLGAGDLQHLGSGKKLLLAWRYWVTRNAL